LADLPEDLEKTYEKAMERTMKKRTREKAHLLLLWLLYSFQPLTVKKVEEILRVDLRNNRMEKANEMDVNIHLIIDSTLIAVNTYSLVQLAHSSVKEFLITQYNALQTSRSFPINELLAHEMISQICIVYLMEIMQLIDMQNIPLLITNHPLGYYAVIYWLEHAKFGEVGDCQNCLHNKIVKFATIGMPSFQKWAKVYQYIHGNKKDCNEWESVDPTAYLIREGLLTASHHLIESCNPSELQ
jgi:hypothetical protein